MKCEEIKADLLDYIDGQLDEGGSEVVASHLERCEGCREEVAEIRQTWSLLGELGEAHSSADMRSRFSRELALHERHAGRKRRGAAISGWLDSFRPKQPALQAGIAGCAGITHRALQAGIAG